MSLGSPGGHPFLEASYIAHSATLLVVHRVCIFVLAGVELKSLVASVLFVPVRGEDVSIHTVLAPGWTLNFEMFFYIVFAAGLMLPRKYGLPTIVATLIALILLGLATKPTQAAFIYWTNPLFLEFVFGLAIAYAYEKGKTLSSKMRMDVFALGVLILAIFSLSHYPTPK
jgi:exopolysaccharide production protein ExoZ